MRDLNEAVSVEHDWVEHVTTYTFEDGSILTWSDGKWLTEDKTKEPQMSQ
jgi:hypothetical protein